MRSGSECSGPENSTLKEFLDLLNAASVDPNSLAGIVARLESENVAEAALAQFRKWPMPATARKDVRWVGLRQRLESAAEKARLRRAHQWQLDPGRRTFRFRFEVRKPACDLNPSSLHRALVQTFLEAGLPLALGLEKTPRPMVTLGPPLPLGTPGLGEWVDCVLREPSLIAAEAWPTRLTLHCPEGLAFLKGEVIPNHSAPLVELAREAHWRWDCPPSLLELARTRLGAFERAGTFEIEKTGKVDGKKGIKRVEVRALVVHLEWQMETLLFSTRLEPGEAMGPAKLLGGILGIEPSQIVGITRLEVVLAEDARLDHGMKYETKLHNIFEDAVLLESDGPIAAVEDDDDLLLDR